jgi:CTP synthase (UTP-ammonia lyase)
MRIALIGNFNAAVTAHQAIPKALALSAQACDCEVEQVWLATEKIAATDLRAFDAFWCVPASPYRSMQGALSAIRYARESGRPFLGTCGGFQHCLIEYARHVLGIADAAHAETDPDAPDPVISKLACSLIEAEETIHILPGTRLAEIYGASEIRERYHCSFGLNPAYRERLEQSPLRISAIAAVDEVRAVELPSHPFYLCTLFQVERSGLAGTVHPLITAFVRAADETASRLHLS